MSDERNETGPLGARLQGVQHFRLTVQRKGPEGEQLEFVQALGPVKAIFDNAREARRRAARGR